MRLCQSQSSGRQHHFRARMAAIRIFPITVIHDTSSDIALKYKSAVIVGRVVILTACLLSTEILLVAAGARHCPVPLGV